MTVIYPQTYKQTVRIETRKKLHVLLLALCTDSLKTRALWTLARLCLSLTGNLITGSQNFGRDAFLVACLSGWRKPTAMLKFWNPGKEHRQLPQMTVFNSFNPLCSGVVDKWELLFLEEMMVWNACPTPASDFVTLIPLGCICAHSKVLLLYIAAIKINVISHTRVNGVINIWLTVLDSMYAKLFAKYSFIAWTSILEWYVNILPWYDNKLSQMFLKCILLLLWKWRAKIFINSFCLF